MRVLLLTNEYPPRIYGGAGVHIDHLSRDLAKLTEVEVLCFGDQSERSGNLAVTGIGLEHPIVPVNSSHAGAFNALLRNLEMAARAHGPEVVHCHTWYSHFAGILVKQTQNIPLLLTTHSLEPSRPWKAEQLGEGGYRLSCWVERTAYQNADGIIAVSQEMARDVIAAYGVDPAKVRVIHNGVDPDEFPAEPDSSTLRRHGIDPFRPYALFVGRITRQKGIRHFLRAAELLDPAAQIVLCAAAPDTPQLADEVESAVRKLEQRRNGGVVWVRDAVPLKDLPSIYAGAAVYCCPSIYEPFGITNLEAMSCRTPVVATRTGGIPEIIVEGETGYLVDIDHVSASDPEARDPEGFARGLATAMNRILGNHELGRELGEKARQRVVDHFSWAAIARQTLSFYEEVAARFRG